ncbi:MAG: Holliday junction branch migration protein RuvA [Vampirovibrionia bacterium]
MFSFLKGTIASKQQNTPFGTFIILEVNNVGYSILVNQKTLDKYPKEGANIVIYTQLIHREDTMYLCGFYSAQERDLFNFLQSVSGVGVKVALNILNNLTPVEIISAVIKQDHKALSKSKGIGPKIAQRMVLELKDKMINWRPELEKQQDIKTSDIQDLESYVEAESVLISLGYNDDEIKNALNTALQKIEDETDTEKLLQEALRWLSI